MNIFKKLIPNKKTDHSFLETMQARIEILESQLMRLNKDLELSCVQMDQIESTQNTLEELATRNSSLNYDNANKIMERLKADILTSFYNYSDTITTTEERRLHKAMEDDVKMVFDNLETEIGEIESGIQDSIAREEST